MITRSIGQHANRLAAWVEAAVARQERVDQNDLVVRLVQELLTMPSYNRMVVSMHIALDHDRIFGALGDATRRDIVRRAIDGKEGVAELAAHYPMSFAAVQKHVAVLERAGLVSKHRSGRRKVVRTNLEALRVARRLLDRYEELWRQRVERMNHLITDSPKEAYR